MQRNYEMVMLVRQDASQQQAEAVAQKVIALIEGAGGKIARFEDWGVRALAYRIDNNRKAHYYCFNFAVTPELPVEIERQLRIHEDVIRILILQTENLPTDPSVVMSRKDERAARLGSDDQEDGE